MIMGSSEIVDSGRFPAAQKSNFAQTCSLLSQYLKEKGSFGDLSLGLNRNFEPNGAPAKTMNLLPMIEKTGKNSEAPAARTPNIPVKQPPNSLADILVGSILSDSVVKSEPETVQNQMTIFYNGQVLVFNDFPAEKAKEIMALASEGTFPNVVNTYATTNMVAKPAESATNLVTSAPSILTSFANSLVQESAQSPLQPNVNDFPITRKASLTRFLEKRKDRITERAPYPMGAAASKQAERKAWLGFASQFPLQMQRHL